jgi:hypothetical protein
MNDRDRQNTRIAAVRQQLGYEAPTAPTSAKKARAPQAPKPYTLGDTRYVLDNGNSSQVHHSAKCRCLRLHDGPYLATADLTGLRPCGYPEC